MNDSDNLDVSDALKISIIQYTDQCFESTGHGLLLSKLGQTIFQQSPELREALGKKKLAEFIEQEMTGSIQVLTSPQNRIVKITLPARVNIEDDVMHFFPRRETTANPLATPRYSRAFWAAFSQPLADNKTRLVGLEPQVHFDDVDSTAPAPMSKISVPQDFIVTEALESDPASRGKKIAANIDRWLQANAIEVQRVSVKAGDFQAGARSSDSRGSLLEILIAALGEADLKRIQMPLDVIAKLHNPRK